MSLKNYTKIEVADDVRRQILAAFDILNTARATCALCEMPPRWAWQNEHYRGVCQDCQQTCDHGLTVTGYIITRSGSQQVQRRCLGCGAGPSRAGSAPRGSQYLDVCFADHRDSTTCEHRGSLDGVELHHYAPRNTFPDPGNWATGHLCRPCHHLWHRTMDGYLWHRSRAKQQPSIPTPAAAPDDNATPEQVAYVKELLGL